MELYSIGQNILDRIGLIARVIICMKPENLQLNKGKKNILFEDLTNNTWAGGVGGRYDIFIFQ